MDRPNILFINTDQQTWNVVSAYGNPHVRTPHMDRLHRNGTSFMRSYCADPVCSASRASWMTGRYTSENGVCFNAGQMHEDIPDLGQILNRNGYDAVHCGKWHIGGRSMRDSFQNLYTGKRDIAAGGAEYYDRVSTHALIDFLDSRNSSKPFYLQIGLVNPHDICEYEHTHEFKAIPGPEAQGISPDALPPLPENFDYDERETVVQQVFRRGKQPLLHHRILNGIADWTDNQWRFLAWNHARFTEMADHQIGLILNALERSSFRDDTLIIFMADHGEANGQHRTFQKFALYEESIRVPTIVATLGDRLDVGSGRFDREHFVSGVDLLPTVLDYAAVDAPDDVQGRSLRPLLERGASDWPDYAYVESNYWGRAIITGRFKYVTEYRPTEPEDFIPPGPDPDALGLEQLFDLDNDPWETKNIASEPEFADAVASCRAKLLEHESRLVRQPLRDGSPRDRLIEWGDPLRQRWATSE